MALVTVSCWTSRDVLVRSKCILFCPALGSGIAVTNVGHRHPRVVGAVREALDHLEHALKAASGHEDVVKGFALVRDEIVKALGRVGIQPFEPKGEMFDPNEHEAMIQQPSEDAESGTVIEVYQQGYRINGQVLRPARVVVAQ